MPGLLDQAYATATALQTCMWEGYGDIPVPYSMTFI